MAEKMRVDKLIANMGRGTRREVHGYIKQGKVTVNGIVIKKIDISVDTVADVVVCLGETVVYEKNIYMMMNKPAGYVSANTDAKDPTVMELLEYPYCNIELFVAGRLDKDTQGLMILTNNGKFSHNMLAPKKHVPKTYYADVAGLVTKEDGELFAKGVTIDKGYTCMPAQLRILKSDDISQIELTICEGKFHQVKKMFHAIGKEVIFLKRIQMGGLLLDDTLPLGSVKKLTLEEVLSIGADLGE